MEEWIIEVVIALSGVLISGFIAFFVARWSKMHLMRPPLIINYDKRPAWRLFNQKTIQNTFDKNKKYKEYKSDDENFTLTFSPIDSPSKYYSTSKYQFFFAFADNNNNFIKFHTWRKKAWEHSRRYLLLSHESEPELEERSWVPSIIITNEINRTNNEKLKKCLIKLRLKIEEPKNNRSIKWVLFYVDNYHMFIKKHCTCQNFIYGNDNIWLKSGENNDHSYWKIGRPKSIKKICECYNCEFRKNILKYIKENEL